ncbi:hypothetical protein K457DRAFT_431369 [Linnemannia elongata AG-77]|uniref:Uncharacterized protein n=1 Tax=Linnemannia elongata AG-77 TaxID=1314771 RepID=A0A197JYU8_9FUNG|nr:hypothetical protein K457DRAFT_431369 [Linnemannia elongata AG-77]
MENLEMIKDFEMGNRLEKEDEERLSRQQQFDRSQDNDYITKDRTSWEEIDRSQLETATTHHSRVGSDPRRNGKVILSSDTTIGSSGYPSLSTKATKPAETTFDLYDELMTKEIDEATSTPLIDFLVDDDAREPATNTRTQSQPARGSTTTTAKTNTTRHERVPAVSVRY